MGRDNSYRVNRKTKLAGVVHSSKLCFLIYRRQEIARRGIEPLVSSVKGSGPNFINKYPSVEEGRLCFVLDFRKRMCTFYDLSIFLDS